MNSSLGHLDTMTGLFFALLLISNVAVTTTEDFGVFMKESGCGQEQLVRQLWEEADDTVLFATIALPGESNSHLTVRRFVSSSFQVRGGVSVDRVTDGVVKRLILAERVDDRDRDTIFKPLKQRN